MTDLPPGASPVLHDLARWIGTWIFVPAFRVHVHHAERIPPTGPVVLVANHSALVDGPLLFGLVGRRAVFLVKREMFRGVVGWALPRIGQLGVRRGEPDRRPLMAAVEVLRGGGLVGVFPEGTRGEGDFASIRAGLAYFAVRGGAPIVPVAVLGSSDRPGRLIKALPPLRSRVDVVFGYPFDAGDGSGRRTRKALDEATARIQKQLTAHLENARRLTGR